MPNVIENPTKFQFTAPADLVDRETEIRTAVKPSPLAIAPTTLVGTWTNVDKTTRGLVKLIISATGANLSVHGFGACHPTPCDWGASAGIPYAENVNATPAIGFSAFYKFAFKETILVGHLDAGLLRVETFDHFTDGSGRSDYFSRFYMEK
jgi:hypothetical protein